MNKFKIGDKVYVLDRSLSNYLIPKYTQTITGIFVLIDDTTLFFELNYNTERRWQKDDLFLTQQEVIKKIVEELESRNECLKPMCEELKEEKK
jgi:hypothetical protein